VKRYTQEQIIGILKEHEAGAKVADLVRRHGVSEQSFYRWKSKYSGMEMSEAGRLRELERENARLMALGKRYRAMAICCCTACFDLRVWCR
jgi:putative transposase